MIYAIAENQEEKGLILAHAHEKGLFIGKFIALQEVDSLAKSDVVIVCDMVAFGKNFMSSLALIIKIAEKNINILFIKDPDLSITGDKILKMFKSILALERKFASIRTIAGIKAARESGAKLGRPQGASGKTKVLDKHRQKIEDYLRKKVSLGAIMKIINADLEKPLSYFTYRRFAQNL